MDVLDVVTALALLAVGVAAGWYVGVLWSRGRPAERAAAVDALRLAEGIDRLGDQLADLHHDRAVWQGELTAQVAAMRDQTGELRRETHALATALRRPTVRGRWGELHLRRAVELAGMVDRCDFSEQVRLADGALRPDVVVHLAGGRSLVVDAKVPLDAFLDAAELDGGDADQAERQRAHLARHARQVRSHVDALGAKRYWAALPDSPELVVLFVPGDAFLAAALEADPGLLEHAATAQVVLATPTTLIALLRTVAHGWRQEALAERAEEIQRTGRELHQRLRTWAEHLDALGRSLGAATRHYNSAVGSLESRVLVSARRLAELGVTDEELPGPRAVGDLPRRTTVADPHDGREPEDQTGDVLGEAGLDAVVDPVRRPDPGASARGA
ncbi:DNA recombination protein RmuC [Nocardioides sp. CPCC 205120]|uniref:DNA recombination protein RmuC n=1 Tax=Nocardioides sp. CPCC 205120 TaxID=3406462 RepID=UPI003B5050FC